MIAKILSKFAVYIIYRYMDVQRLSAFAAAMILSATMFSATTALAQDAQTYEKGNEGTPARRWGIIDFSVSYLRQSPDYESALETQELMGTPVEIVGEQGYWLQARTPQPYTAWCTDKGVHEVDETGIEEWTSARRYIVVSPHSAVYSERTSRSDVVCDLVEGDIVRAVLGKPQPKAHPQGLPVRRNGWAKVETPSGRAGWVKTSDIRDFRKWASESAATEKTVVETAMRFVGTPYLWGGMSPNGFDCSGLVRFAYFMNGLLLPRNANQMAFCGRPVPVFGCQAEEPGDGSEGHLAGIHEEEHRAEHPKEQYQFCADSLRAGDLLFFGKRGTDGTPDRITHVGLYIGDGRMIHSSHLVRVNSLVPGEADYYENARRLLSAVRIIGHEDESRDGRFKAERTSDSIYYFR